MNTKEYHLYIDELGVYSIKDQQSDLYILCGCALNKNQKDALKIEADQIKYRFWQRTDVVFHSYEIGRNLNDFKIFYKNQQLKVEFLKDLYKFLNKAKVFILPVIVEKAKAKEYNWNDIKIINETSKNLFYHFICFLLGERNRRGKVIIESSTLLKDKLYLESFAYFQSPGSKEFGKDYKKIQNILTSINFVTKKNSDIEEQIVDLFSYAVKCRYLKEYKKFKFQKDSYESQIINILERKLFKIPGNISEIKKGHFRKIDQFCILPKHLKRTRSS